MRLGTSIAVLLLAAHPAAAQTHASSWPGQQALRLVSPFPAGSSLDTIARPVFEEVSKRLGQGYIVENRPGAGGTIGMAAVAKAEPDGYTLLINSSVHTITPSTYSNLRYDTVRDFAGIAPLAQFPNVLVVPPQRYKTIAEMVEFGRGKPDDVHPIAEIDAMPHQRRGKALCEFTAIADLVERDSGGFILTGPDLPRDKGRPRSWRLTRDPYLLETSIPGLFAAGDVRWGSSKRVAAAVGEGSVAVRFVHEYLSTV